MLEMNNKYKTISFWSWNESMKEEEVRLQIREFAEQGFGGFFVHSRAGLTIEYLGDDWFKTCAIALEEAENLGLDVWIYDEDGWPSGFAGGRVPALGVDYQSKKINFKVGKPSCQDNQILAAYRKKSDINYSRISLSDATEDDVFCYYTVNPHYVDLLNPDVTKKFIEITHEAYYSKFSKYFGSVIKGAFTDEPQIPTNGASWSVAMTEYYQLKYGRDLLDDLWLLNFRGEGFKAFRYKFFKMTSELINNSFSKQLDEWCNAHGIAFTGHFACEDGLCEQAIMHGGSMSNYFHMGIPGIDHLGRRLTSTVLTNQLKSAAHQSGKKFTLSESYGCSGWDLNFDDLIGITGWQAAHGINTICAHLSAYSILGRRKRDYPAFFSYQEPWYDDFHYALKYTENLIREISESERQTKVAVISPIESLYCFAHDGRYSFESKTISGEFRKLLENLEDIQLDFDLADESVFKDFVVENEGIGNDFVNYKLVIVPYMPSISETTLKKLSEFQQNGGSVVFVNSRPELVGGEESDLIDTIHKMPAIDIQNNLNIWHKYIKAYPIQDDIKLYDERLWSGSEGILLYYGQTEYGNVAYLYNHRLSNEINSVVRLKGNVSVSLYNPINNSEKLIPTSFDGEYTYSSVTVPSYSGILLKIRAVKEQPRVDTLKLVSSERFISEKVTLSDENALTLDYCRYRINEGAYSDMMPIINITNEIYGRLSSIKGSATVDVEFQFDTAFSKMPTLSLVAEKVKGCSITVNGTPISTDGNWWIDRDFNTYDITKHTQNGKNTVVVTYSMGSSDGFDDFGEIFESERNRFFYDIEPESIYIKGDFDVSYTGKVVDKFTHYSLSDGEFILVDSTEKSDSDLTSQNLWFYRGDANVSGIVKYSGIGKVFINAPEYKATFLEIIVNGKNAGVIMTKNSSLEITEFLTVGDNEVIIRLSGHNRNLLGPHHHIKGWNFFVGPDTFKGEKGWEDFIYPEIKSSSTWTDEYSFVRFSAGCIMLEYFN